MNWKHKRPWQNYFIENNSIYNIRDITINIEIFIEATAEERNCLCIDAGVKTMQDYEMDLSFKILYSAAYQSKL